MALNKKSQDFLQQLCCNTLQIKKEDLEKKAEAPTEATTTTTATRVELTLEERYQLCLSVGEECIQPDELRELLARKPHPICYDGFEPSGRMHIAQGIMKAINVNKLTRAGCTFIFWVADWFAMLNNKMGGDLERIRTVGKYMIEVWKALGMDMTNVKFLWCADEINAHSDEYWSLVMDIARKNSLSRIKRCGQIMGRTEGDENPAAQIMYPIMQCTDIFFLKADICQLGMDQRKVNMLAREYVEEGAKFRKPIILSHHMLMGLKEAQAKMSKSDPESAIFMEDSPEDVLKKIRKAFCPEKIVEGNPILDYCKHIIFPGGRGLDINRSAEEGGPISYTAAEYAKFETDFVAGGIHPSVLKPAVADALNHLIEPVRVHFRDNAFAASLLEEVRSFAVTR